jgi:glycosyltransferase involved in cell wall biosynthesis
LTLRVALSGWFWENPETGSGQYVRSLVTELARSQPAPQFVVLVPSAPVETADHLAPNVSVRVVPARRTHLGKVWWEQIVVPRTARHLGADLLHVPYWAPPMRSSLPTVVTVHDLIPLLLKPYRGSTLVRLYTAFVRATSPRATLLLTDSEASRQDILRHLRVPPARVRLVHLAADEVFRSTPAPNDDAVLREMGLSPGYVLYLGGFDVRKNLRSVFATFVCVSQTVADAQLVIAGKLPAMDSDFAPDPRRLAREVGIPEARVRFVGFVPESAKPALYRGARAFMYPSIYEGFGLPPLEALACGVPVVGSNTSSLPEVVGDAGVLVDPDDVAGIADALIRLLRDDAFHIEMQQRAMHQAARFSWAKTAQATFAAYQDVTGEERQSNEQNL